MTTLVNKVNYIARHEGFRDRPYLDTLGYVSIGYGQKLGDTVYEELPPWAIEFPAIPREAALAWLVQHVTEIVDWCRYSFDWYPNLSHSRKLVIISMVYQLGRTGMLGFKKMIAAIEKERWEEASHEMMDSKWARQTPARAKEQAVIMLNGHIGWE